MKFLTALIGLIFALMQLFIILQAAKKKANKKESSPRAHLLTFLIIPVKMVDLVQNILMLVLPQSKITPSTCFKPA